MLLYLTAIASAVSIGLEEAYPLWALSSYDVGGLEWNTIEIGKVLACTGVGMTIFQLFVYNWLVKKIGIVKMQTRASYLVILMYLALPNVKYMSWNDSSLRVVSVVVMTILLSCSSAISVGMALASTSPVPPHVRGKLSGLFIMSQSLGRATGPMAWATMYAWSVSSSSAGVAVMPLVGYRLVFNISALLMGVVALLSHQTLTFNTMTK
ncbi:unnamed protein product, partial [Sphacelaria rigidula]